MTLSTENESHGKHNFLPPKERKARREQHRKKLLNFLRDETWSNTQTLASLLGFKRPDSVLRLLRSFEKEGIIRHAVFTCDDYPRFSPRGSYLYGITPHGLVMADENEPSYIARPYFEPSKISVHQIQHHLDTQYVRLRAEQYGYTDWTLGIRLGKISRREKRPDAVCMSPEKHMIAIEVERHVKTMRRYEEIMSSHLQQIKLGKYDYVVYLSPTESIAKHLKKLFYAVESIPVRKSRVKLTEFHYQKFLFYSYSQWL